MGDASNRWRGALARWAIPAEILERAPESPHGFSVGVFAQAADDAATRDTPSRHRALARLPERGTVLDVGCGAGAASLALLPRPAHIVGVDESGAMLDAFAERCEKHGVEHTEVQGRWPDAQTHIGPCDLVVCHHVFYNVADLDRFAAALDTHAHSGVICELTAGHPLSWMNPLWRELHGVERPEEPTFVDAVAVLAELGIAPEVERWEGPVRFHGAGSAATVEFVRRRLCLPPERDEDIRRALERHPPPASRELVTLDWEPQRHGTPDYTGVP